VFIDNAVGMVWWKNMADGKKMQSMVLTAWVNYGESTNPPTQTHMEAANQLELMVLPCHPSFPGTAKSRLWMRS
jgi:hypothetical protein